MTRRTLRDVERHRPSHGAKVFSKLVAMVRIENLVSRTIFENRNVLKSRAARGASNSFSQTLVCKNEFGTCTPHCPLPVAETQRQKFS
jgi:hypothetical protein